MDIITASKRGDALKLSRILIANNSKVNFQNINYANVGLSIPHKAIYCGQCYQQVIQNTSTVLLRENFDNQLTCAWPDHPSNSNGIIMESNNEMCGCPTYGENRRCRWLICITCFQRIRYDLKTWRQISRIQEGYTALIAACSTGQIECVKLLLAQRIDVNASDPTGFTALMAASVNGYADAARLLLRNGANLNAVDKMGVCALYMACEVGDVALVEVLLGFQPDLGIREVGGATVLYAAAFSGHIGIMEALLDRGLDPKATDTYGNTPLHKIAGKSSTEAVQLLLERGAVYEPHRRDTYAPIVSAVVEGVSLSKQPLPSMCLRPRSDIQGDSASVYVRSFVAGMIPPEAVSEEELQQAGALQVFLQQSTSPAGVPPADSRNDSWFDPIQRRTFSSDETACSSPTMRTTESLAPRVSREVARIMDNRRGSGTPPASRDLPERPTQNLPRINCSPLSSPNTRDTKKATIKTLTVNAIKHPKDAAEELKRLLSPPLPLMRFNAVSEKEVTVAKTITGEELRNVANLTGPSRVQRSVPLCDPMHARRIAKWFMKRSYKELNWRQMESYDNHFGTTAAAGGEELAKPDLFDVLVYESLLHTETAEERLERNSARVPEEQIFQNRYERLQNQIRDGIPIGLNSSANTSNTALNSLVRNSSNKDLAALGGGGNCVGIPCHSPSLQFDGEFESGNIEKVVRVIGRETLLDIKIAGNAADIACPNPVDQEYDITLRKDINTNGNIQWYYFSASTLSVGAGGGSGTERSVSSSSSKGSGASNAGNGSRMGTPSLSIGMTPLRFPLRVRFNIINMQKKDSLYNYGMRPATYSDSQLCGEDWVHRGDDVCYYRSGITSIKPSRGRDKKKVTLQYQYTLTFTYTFNQPDTVYFAHTFPYTYSDLQLSLCRMEQKYHHSGFFHQRTLCETLAGNSCDIISISERSEGLVESKNKPAIVITGRVHPGESNSSFMVQGFLDFITSERAEAVKLRKSFVFHIIPMLNPDGVIHGNYRCSLAATDLNRRYGGPHPNLHPTILAKKNFLRQTAKNRSVLLYLDLHGHSKLKNAFLYGCDITMQSDRINKELVSKIPAEDLRQRRIFSRVFPKVLSSVSNAKQGGYFSYRDCAFVVDKSKAGTGRVVCWRELKIAASYTIEASFCGNGDNRESRLIKRATEASSSSGYGAGSGSGKAIKRSSTLPRLQSNTAVTGDNSVVGIACNNATAPAEDVQGGDSDASDDEVEAQIPLPKKKSAKTKSLASSTKLKKSKGLRKSSSISMLSRAGEVTAGGGGGGEETTLDDLLQKYDQFIHYRKEDLLNMGRDIGLAIYHFANLSHSSVENELKIALMQDLQEKDKARHYFTPMPQEVATGDSTVRRASEDVGAKSTSVPSRPVRAASEKMASSHYGHVQSAAWAVGGDCSDVSEASGGDGSQDPFDSDADIDGLDAPLVEENGENFKSAGIADEQIDFDESDGDSGSESGSQKETTKLKEGAAEAVNAADLAQLLREYSQTALNTLELDMATRSLLKPGVFSSAALESAIHEYPEEFLAETSSEHVGMRMKCEFNIRRALRCASDISLTDAALKQHQAAFQAQVEEESGSVEDSDSNPSVDNVPATKMLKNVQKLKDSRNLVVALKRAAVRRKKKEIEIARKAERKEAKKLAKQAREARKVEEEAVLAQATKEAAAQAARQSAAIAQRNADVNAQSLQERVMARRKTSIFQSVPKHAPLYRLAPEEAKSQPQLLPIKVVNFRDHDTGEAPTYHSNAGSVDPPVRGRTSSGASVETVPAGSAGQVGATESPHLLALSMANLASAASRLYFHPIEGTASEPATPPSLINAASAMPVRFNSLHNSFLNPADFTPPMQDSPIRGTSLWVSTLRPSLHCMAPLLPASTAAGEISARERERVTYTAPSENAQPGMSSARPRPRSGSATSAARRSRF